MTYYYKLNVRKISDCCGEREGYGIDAYDEDGAIAARITDITCDRMRADTLVRTCNAAQLDVIHLDDVVYDFLCSPDTYPEIR